PNLCAVFFISAYFIFASFTASSSDGQMGSLGPGRTEEFANCGGMFKSDVSGVVRLTSSSSPVRCGRISGQETMRRWISSFVNGSGGSSSHLDAVKAPKRFKAAIATSRLTKLSMALEIIWKNSDTSEITPVRFKNRK